MNNFKKYLCTFFSLVLIFIFTFNCTAFADTLPDGYEGPDPSNTIDWSAPTDTSFDDTTWTREYEDGTEDEYVPSPYLRWIALKTVGLVLDFKLGGKAVFSVSYSINNNYYHAKVVTKLQSYRNGSWTTLYTKTYNGGPSDISEGSYYVTKGYKYRTNNKITVYNASGNVVESTTLNCTRTYN